MYQERENDNFKLPEIHLACINICRGIRVWIFKQAFDAEKHIRHGQGRSPVDQN